MSENGSGLGECVIADGDIEVRFGKQASQRPPDLHGFEPRARCHAAAELIQHPAQREPERNFNQPRLFYPATQLQDHRPA